ncbi:MAG: hypothetical protein IPK21_19625 [Haliscomenobacter sp.]|nr:hypothetical protein [Haliscomenobacter sp.]
MGHIMGVDPALIPANYAEGEQLGQMIIHHQAEPSPEGKELAAAAIHFMESMAGGRCSTTCLKRLPDSLSAISMPTCSAWPLTRT